MKLNKQKTNRPQRRDIQLVTHKKVPHISIGIPTYLPIRIPITNKYYNEIDHNQPTNRPTSRPSRQTDI